MSVGELGIVIQARAGSTRMPRKIFLPLPFESGDSILAHTVRRCLRVRGGTVAVATSDQTADDDTARHAESLGVRVVRGSESDVLGRYVAAAGELGFDTIVRITADCPCVDPAVMTRAIRGFAGAGVDYYSNTRRRSFPHGLDVEVFSTAALLRADRACADADLREHVTAPFYASDGFSCADFVADAALTAPEIRVTVDVPQDYALLNLVFLALGPEFSASRLIDLFRSHPWLSEVNRDAVQREVFASAADELAAAETLLETAGMRRAAELLTTRTS